MLVSLWLILYNWLLLTYIHRARFIIFKHLPSMNLSLGEDVNIRRQANVKILLLRVFCDFLLVYFVLITRTQHFRVEIWLLMSIYYSSAITDTLIHILQEIREKKKQKLPEAWTTGTELHGSWMEWLQISKKFWFVIAARASVSMLYKAGWAHTAP